MQRQFDTDELPPKLAEFIAKLPPAHLFSLNISSIDKVLAMLGEYTSPLVGLDLSSSAPTAGEKRKLDDDNAGSSTVSNATNVPVPSASADIFKQRQRLKAQKVG